MASLLDKENQQVQRLHIQTQHHLVIQMMLVVLEVVGLVASVVATIVVALEEEAPLFSLKLQRFQKAKLRGIMEDIV